MTTAAVVLAAGGGSRFDGEGHKLLAGIGGEPMASIAVAAAVESGIGPVIVVVGAVALDLPLEVTTVANPRWREGIASSLQAALAAAGAAGHDAVVVGLADQPGVPAEAWRLVSEASGAPIAVATYGGQRANPVRLAADVWDRLPATGDEGARLLIRRCPELVVEVPCPGSHDDVDTEEDLRRWS